MTIGGNAGEGHGCGLGGALSYHPSPNRTIVRDFEHDGGKDPILPPPGSRLFETDTGVVGPTHWGV